LICFDLLTFFACSSFENTTTNNVFKINELISMYSVLQLLERMYNNYYRAVYWPAIVQIGALAAIFLTSLCLSKWHIVSKDPRALLLLICILEGFTACVFAPYCASKVNTQSRLFLTYQRRVFSNKYLRKLILSKPILSIKVSDNFIDNQFPLTVLMFCVNNVFSLLVIFKESQ